MNRLLKISLVSLLAACTQPKVNKDVSENKLVDKENEYVSELVTPSLNELEVWEDATNFFVLGDWGRNGYYHQADMGEMMQQIAMVVEPEFIISTGDNFYANGVASTQDSQWESSFENVYKGNLLHVPWYVILGNHDYRGNEEAQIEYSNVSRRWTMPARYWSEKIEMEDESEEALFVFMDTNPFEDKYHTEKKYKNVWDQDSSVQLKWFDQVLDSASDTQWRIVTGHHPLYSGGKRKNKTKDVRGHLESHFDDKKVDVYFCGHEHDIQYIKNEDHFTHHIISGAGAEVRPTGNLSGTKFAVSETAVVVASLLKDKMLIQVVDYKGTVLYKTTILKKR